MHEEKQSDSEAGGKQRKRRRQRKPLRAEAEPLRRWALWYLDRYPASVGHLRRLMARKIETSARVHGTDREAGRDAAEALLAELVRAGVLDDRGYARQTAGALHRRGLSRRAIAARLKVKGLGEEEIRDALEQLAEESDDPDLAAALRYIRRRRLGPYRPEEERTERRDRDLAALARQGFGYELARKVIDSDDPDSLLDPP